MPKRILAALSIALLAVGAFVFGFASSLHLKRSASGDVRRQVLLQKGDAPDPARAEVLEALRAFQAGYVKRNPIELDAFMSRLFPESGDPLLLGTDTGEWVHGYRAVGEFIREDWLKWGDFRFDVENSVVSSAGDVAWIASTGSVRGQHSERPLRFSAVLTRNGHQWRFRQVQFQWDERDPRPADLLRPDTYLKLGRWVLQRISPTS
jgi:hypothetical protein